MELRIVNQLGEDTGRKANLNDDVFGIEPNEHAMYLDVKAVLGESTSGYAQSEGTRRDFPHDQEAAQAERNGRCTSR